MPPPTGIGVVVTNEYVAVHGRPLTRSAALILNFTFWISLPIGPDSAAVRLESREVATLMLLGILAMGAAPRCSPVRVTTTRPVQFVKRLFKSSALHTCLMERQMLHL
jgi:hypothetical protein